MAAPSAARALRCDRCGKPNCSPCLRGHGCDRWKDGLCPAFWTHGGGWLCGKCKLEAMESEVE